MVTDGDAGGGLDEDTGEPLPGAKAMGHLEAWGRKVHGTIRAPDAALAQRGILPVVVVIEQHPVAHARQAVRRPQAGVMTLGQGYRALTRTQLEQAETGQTV